MSHPSSAPQPRSLNRPVALTLLGCCLLLSACATEGVQDTRAAGLENRQDRMDSRTDARQDRWAERGAREDARSQAAFDSW